MKSGKSKYRKKIRRAMRQREKNSDVKFDKMIGRCCRRGWGIGISSNETTIRGEEYSED